jgi:hypothetical protein
MKMGLPVCMGVRGFRIAERVSFNKFDTKSFYLISSKQYNVGWTKKINDTLHEDLQGVTESTSRKTR